MSSRSKPTGLDPVAGRRGISLAGRWGRGVAGFGLLELLVTILVILTLLATSMPRIGMTLHEHRLRGAAVFLRGLLRHARSRAAAEGRHIAVVFDEAEGDPVFRIHGDGNGNGIRRRDVDAGVDPKLREPYRLSETFPGIRYGSEPTGAGVPFLPGLRIGRSHMVSFSPLGSSTTGTLFLSNRYGLVYAVVIFGSTGRVRIARYRGGRWENVQ